MATALQRSSDGRTRGSRFHLHTLWRRNVVLRRQVLRIGGPNRRRVKVTGRQVISGLGSSRNLGIKRCPPARRLPACLSFLVVTLADCLTNRSTCWTSSILAPTIVTKHISAAHTMRYSTLLVLAVRNVLPKLLHTRAVRGDRTLAWFILTS